MDVVRVLPRNPGCFLSCQALDSLVGLEEVLPQAFILWGQVQSCIWATATAAPIPSGMQNLYRPEEWTRCANSSASASPPFRPPMRIVMPSPSAGSAFALLAPRSAPSLPSAVAPRSTGMAERKNSLPTPGVHRSRMSVSAFIFDPVEIRKMIACLAKHGRGPPTEDGSIGRAATLSANPS